MGTVVNFMSLKSDADNGPENLYGILDEGHEIVTGGVAKQSTTIRLIKSQISSTSKTAKANTTKHYLLDQQLKIFYASDST